MSGKSIETAKIMLKGILNIRLAVAFLIIAALLAGYFFAYHMPLERAKGWMAKGDSAMAEGKIDTAIYDYMRGSREFPRLKGLHLALGKALLLDGRGDVAIEALEREVALDEDSVEGHMLLGFLHLLSVTGDDDYGHYILDRLPPLMGLPGMAGRKPQFAKIAEHPLTEALFHLKYAEDLAPHQLPAAYGLAVMEGLRGDFDQAGERLEEILERNPNDKFALETLEQVSYFATMARFGGDTGEPFAPLFMPGDSGTGLNKLPPLDTGWVEGGEEDTESATPSGPPDISQDGSWEPLSDEELRDPENQPGASITPEGDVILRPNAFKREPQTRPIGPVISIPGEPPQHLVTIGNRYKSGQVSLSVGQTGEVPKSGVEVTLAEVDGNRVKIVEDGVEYIWVRGKVEWVWIPDEKDKATSDDTQPAEE